MEFEGGTGKLKIVSPVRVTVRDGNMTARLILQSSHYDYMKVDGEKYLPLEGEGAVEGCSVFDIPIKSPDESIDVIGDTTAMSTPHEIEYKLKFDWSVIDGLEGGPENMSNVSDTSDALDGSKEMNASGRADASNGDPAIVSLDNIETVRADDGTVIPKNITGPDGKVIEFTDTVERKYAQMFSIALSDDGYAFIHIEGSGDHLVNLCKPIENIYLVSSSAMDIFATLDEDLSDLAFTGLDKKDCKVEAAVNAMDKGTLKYAGKYSAPDYELMLSEGCDLAIESTMILHAP